MGDWDGSPHSRGQGRAVCFANEILRLRFAAFGMACGWGVAPSSGWYVGRKGVYEGRPYGEGEQGVGFATATRFFGSASLRSE